MDHDPIGVSRDKEDSGIGIKEFELFNQFFSSHLWHHQIGEHEVYLLMGELAGQSHYFIPIGGLKYRITLITQNPGCQASNSSSTTKIVGFISIEGHYRKNRSPRQGETIIH